ncbi:protein phosphatase 1 regulatory subunit 12A isoform X1 [Eurytemora carolleeae]|uniref:protein phosphatase 1 regulatory subunit 12A isoform X1 n=1 Tax=Eurytemora carolleeae TaxID=1294199 RepID=UPI000C77FB6C|nr:protein phosphatase 1 regulatory subunit 12A isoform X1 [Eurytemora carolleeae]|eukprot:XP_023344959.1 protein phosphatase 1 regulatory subunit 12A-like isoform X1 [Eurytemora affinis]
MTLHTFNQRLEHRLMHAPSDLMNFLEACTMGNTERVVHLIEKGVDVNKKGENGATGLMLAAMSNQIEVMTVLLSLQYTDINKTGLQQNTALMYSAMQGSFSGVKLLLAAGSNTATTNTSGKSCLGLAADHTDLITYLEVCSLLVESGLSVTAKDWEVLNKHPEKKLITIMEIFRTKPLRSSLRYLSRQAVLKHLLADVRGGNPSFLFSKLQLPRSLVQYLRHPA